MLDPYDEAAREHQIQHQRQHRDDERRAAQVVPQGDEDDPGPHFAAGEHAHREGQPFAQFPVAVEEQGDEFAEVRKQRYGHHVQGHDAPRHHRLRRRDGGGRGCGVGGSGAGHQRHAHSYEQHEEERDARGDAAFGGRVDMPVAHQHLDDEGREQHLDMDAVLGAVPVFRGEVDRLRQRADRDREPEDAFPVLPHVPRALPAPADGEQYDDDGHDGEHLPPQADHQDLQGNHQQDGVQVVEDGEHLDFAVDPALLELQRRQHREEDARRGRGGEAAQQQVFLPSRRVVPEIGGKQHEDVVEHDEQPGQRRRGHGDEVVGRVGAPARLVDFELAAHVDHDESQADVQQRVGRGLERAVTRAERAGKQLGGHESRHEEEREGEYFAHGSESLFGRSYSFGRIRPRGRRCIRKHMNAFGCRVRTPFRGTASGFTGQRYDFAADSQTGGEAVAAFGGGFRGVKKITAGESAIHNYFVTLRCKTDRKF